MDKNEIIDSLNRLSDMKEQCDVIRMHYASMKDSILTPEIKEQLQDIDAEERSSLEMLESAIQALENDIRDAVKQFGSTVKSEHIQAVFTSGATKWDSDGLDKYVLEKGAVDLLRFRNIGMPSVSIRARK